LDQKIRSRDARFRSLALVEFLVRGQLTCAASLAEKERKLISERTSAALQAKKAAGAKLGNPEVLVAHREASIETRQAQGSVRRRTT
jgi:DNA invertase Pin-like site-specific DNA recombinase